ncbi:hypothetical protein F511_36837 [Dorcoceras hygrometricum]|uniref:Uncharacterized protein n=1 Tax=Dorcoceras hygrometricum TaxID=472368 RepID=A0A2Z7BBP6_9LAMI|nr:hypothetical protein F511_36837 [Dorcoceras hygrometricum]
MQMQCMRHRITTEGSTNKGAKELKHSSKNLQQQWPRAQSRPSSPLSRRRRAPPPVVAGNLFPANSTRRIRLAEFVSASVQPDEGVSVLVVDRIGVVSTAIYREEPNYCNSGWSQAQVPARKLKPRLGTRSHHKGTTFYLHYKTHKWAATSRSTTSQPQPQKVIWNDRASQEESNATSNVPNNGRKRWELLEKS